MKKYFRNIIVFVFLFSFSPPIFAIEYGGFGGRPAYPRPDNPRTESIFIHEVEPSSDLKDALRVINNTQEIKTLLLYSSDSTPSTGGAFACKQFSEEKKDVGSWIVLSKNEVTLKPGTNLIVPFTVKIPENADVGEHNGCILIQEKKTKNSDGQSGVSLSVRTGIRVALTVPGELERKLEIVGLTVRRAKGGFILHPQVKNNGNVSIDTHVSVVTRYIFGLKHAEHFGDYPVLRGDVSDWNFELKQPFLGGIYRSKFFVEYDEDSSAVVGVESQKKLAHLASNSVWFFSLPTIWGALFELIIVCFLAALFFIVHVSYKRKKWIQESWIIHTVTGKEDINSLAAERRTSWKLIAKVNKLQAPYVLKKGSHIRIPPQD